MAVDRVTWLREFARELGTPEPTPEEIDELLQLAADAAHSSERTAAPLSCWLAGKAGRSPSEALALARRVAISLEP